MFFLSFFLSRSDDIQTESVTENCKACELPIHVKNLVFDGERNWHYKCFSCNQCNSALVNQKYYDKAGKLFCNNCFLAEHDPTCYKCTVEIKGRSEYLVDPYETLTIIIIGGVKMNSTSGQVLTWHEDCLQCSVCQKEISMDNVVFRNKLFCKPCYLDTILNQCDKCEKVNISGISSSAISRSIICFSQSLVLASLSEESSGTTPVLHVISVKMYFKRENLET